MAGPPDDLTPDDIPDNLPDNVLGKVPDGGAADGTCQARLGTVRLDRVESVRMALSNRVDNHEARRQLLEHQAGEWAQVASARGRRIEIAQWLLVVTAAGVLVAVLVLA